MATILVVSAHPDDETMWAGGTLAMYAEQGHDVYVLDTTRGEGGEVGEPPLTDYANLGDYREREMRAAARELGVRGTFFLPFQDPHMEINGVAQRIDAPLEQFAAAINDYLRQLKPDLVITHGSNGEYGHPQHIYTYQATRLALAQEAHSIPMLSWCAWYDGVPEGRERLFNQDDRADIVRDVTPWLEKKVAAAMQHRTQHTMFLRNSKTPSVAAMVGHMESFHIWGHELPDALC